MNRIKAAWHGVKWSILRRNIGWCAALFTGISVMNNFVQVAGGRMSGEMMLISPFLDFPIYCLIFTILGLPYYFIRNIIIPPNEEKEGNHLREEENL